MKLIIAGSRTCPEDPDLVDKVLWKALTFWGKSPRKIEVISGMARGADKAGEIWADSCESPIRKFPADWAEHGKRAGLIRNQQMVDYADAALYLWDGESRGTKHCIDCAKKKGIPVYIYRL